MNLTSRIANNISVLMNQAHITQNELADCLGLSRQTVSKYLKGSSSLDVAQLEEIARIFRVPVESLFQETSDHGAKICYRFTMNECSVSDNIRDTLIQYVEKFNILSASTGDCSLFIPEHYELFARVKGKRVSINRELEYIINDSDEVDSYVDAQILSIADEQRKKMELKDSGAIALIPALFNIGIRVVFLDFGTSDISGASICDKMCGCFIFVNDNNSLTIERQLFTIAHELGHILLHRPLYSYYSGELSSNSFSKYLNSMANKFAARLLCPPALLDQYRDELKKARNDLLQILPIAVKIKHAAQLSLQSVMASLRDNGYISKPVLDVFFDSIKNANLLSIEPFPILDEKSIREQFYSQKSYYITDLIVKCFFYRILREEDISVLFHWSIDEAHQYYLNIVEEGKKITSLLNS